MKLGISGFLSKQVDETSGFCHAYSMTKLEYLNRVFSRTRGKDFENYVITQIWAKVEDFGLYPVTQQYVKRPSGYALIDLYFPQINLGIEVDELPYHDNNIDSDKMRMDDIFNSVPDIHLERVRETDYKEVKNQIDGAVRKIQQRAKNYSFFWAENWIEMEYQEKLASIKRNGKLSVQDNIRFSRSQVLNDIFNRGYSEGFFKFGKSWFKLSESKYVWLPHLTPQKDWNNVLSDDWETITQEYIGTKKLENDGMYIDDYLRHVFAKYKDSFGNTSYRFVGIFKGKDVENKVCIFERVSTEYVLGS